MDDGGWESAGLPTGRLSRKARRGHRKLTWRYFSPA